jgi:single-strand DNA-binding protein
MFDNGMKATGFGGLTADPQMTFNNNGTAFLKFSLGVSKSRKVGDDWQQDKHYFNCVVIGKYAEALQNHLSKGTQVFISGNLNFSSWEQDGQKRSKVEIKVDELEIISKGDKQQTQLNNSSNYQKNDTGNKPSYENYPSGNNNSNGHDFSDDIPF